jgi:lipopolysaccharide/colanic/teichoic acid biosynthesis glycosyltransferase
MARRITPLADLVSLARLWRVFRDIRPDIVHGHTPKGGLLAMVGAFLAGVPLRIYTIHGLPLETATGWRKKLLRWTERLSCLLAHQVHAVSPSLRRRALSEGLCAPTKLRVLGQGTVNGVDAANRFAPGPDQVRDAKEVRRLFGIPPGAPVIGFVGRIVRDKGVSELVQAWTAIRSEFPEAHLLVAGCFEPQDPVPAEAERALRSDSRIHLAGLVESMPGMYAAMDVVALPTYREGFPQVPLEAAAMERPVVATRVTGCVDAIVDGVTGTLVPAGDATALADALRAYLKDPALRRGHGRAARARVLREFRPESLWDATEREYRAPARPAAPPAPESSSKRALSSRPVELLLKRILDFSGALAGLLILAPLLGLIALGTWLTLGRPIFFRQVRPGLKGRPFAPIKFRTMRTGPGTDDERMTRLGRFLRYASLDELPQLWNVLRGDMSLVGPRPLLMDYLPLYSPRQARRHDMRPGVTGWCQVNGRNSLTWDRKFDLDVWYVEHWSLLLDLKILLRTAGRVARKSGVDGPGNRLWPGFLGGGPVFPGSETDPFARSGR